MRATHARVFVTARSVSISRVRHLFGGFHEEMPTLTGSGGTRKSDSFVSRLNVVARAVATKCGCPCRRGVLTGVLRTRLVSDTHATHLFRIILAVEQVPLFASFEDFFFLRADFLADFGVHSFFFFQ